MMSGLKGPIFVQQNASCCRQRSTGITGVENLNGVWGLVLQKMKTGCSVLDVSKCLLIGTIASDSVCNETMKVKILCIVPYVSKLMLRTS